MPRLFPSAFPAAILALSTIAIVGCSKKEPPPAPASAPTERIDYAKQMDAEISAYSKKLESEQEAKDNRSAANPSSPASAAGPGRARSVNAGAGNGLAVVMAKQEFINQVESVCATSYAAIATATRAWKTRNYDVLSRANVILTTKLDANQRRSVEATLAQASEKDVLRQVQALSVAERAQTCQNTARAIDRRDHDVIQYASSLAAFE